MSNEEIKVTVVDFGRASLMLRYIDPMTGKQKHRSAKTANKKAAQKAAGVWEDELRSGRYASPIHTTWATFRERYEDEVLSSLAATTDEKVSAVFNVVEKIINPQRLTDLNSARLSYYQTKLRALGRTEATIKGNLAHIKAALAWAVRIGLLVKMPKIEMPKRAKGQKMMKGRPITGEEFDRMLAAVPKIVLLDEPKDVTPEQEAARTTITASWVDYLNGLWLSGLRLAESLELFWDRDDKLCIDLNSKRPMLRIPAALEKGNQDRMLPVAPEFAEWLAKIPMERRTGPVFAPLAKRIKGPRLTRHRVGEIVSAIGEKAGVKVNTDQAGKVKFASAHDLRRSFGERWASKVMPQVLMELMRHESIDTTMRFYVGRNAQATAEVLWQAHNGDSGNTSGNSRPESTESTVSNADVNQ